MIFCFLLDLNHAVLAGPVLFVFGRPGFLSGVRSTSSRIFALDRLALGAAASLHRRRTAAQ